MSDSNVIESEQAFLWTEPVETRQGPSQVILVDEKDRSVGTKDKLGAHQHGGILHRAFSIFLFSQDGHMLLQKRAHCKYHFGGLWSNTCCSHAVPGEDLLVTANIRLLHEMGLSVQLTEAGTFIYRATDPISGLSEFELDHVLVGLTDRSPDPNPHEVDDWQWITVDTLHHWLIHSPTIFTPWFTYGVHCLGQSTVLPEAACFYGKLSDAYQLTCTGGYGALSRSE